MQINTKNYMTALTGSELFENVSESDIKLMLTCFNATVRNYDAGQTIYNAGDKITEIGIVLSGRVYLESNDITGNKSIIRELVVGDVLGELYALSKGERIIFNAVAQDCAEILFMNVEKVMMPCQKACTRHLLTMKNLLTELAGKACNLDRKLCHMSMRSTREKLMSYLREEVRRQGSFTVKVPFNRQELADYLCVERSAMSKELGRMKNDGLVDYSGNVFTIIT